MMTIKDTQALIPQKAPIVMIDQLLEADQQHCITKLTVRKDNIFCENGCLQAAGLAENIAQTAAAQSGYLAKQAAAKGEDLKPVVGFIGAIKNLVIHQLPKIGEELKTEILVEHQVLNFSLIKGTVQVDGQLMAACEMKIFLKED